MSGRPGIRWRLSLAWVATVLSACGPEPPDEPATAHDPIALPDEPSYTIGGWNASDPHHIWRGLSSVGFLDDSTVVFADTDDRVVAVDIRGEGRWIFEGESLRYGLRSGLLVQTMDGKAVVSGEPGLVVLDGTGEVVRAGRVPRPETPRNAMPFRAAVSEALLIYVEVPFAPPPRQRLHVFGVEEEPSTVVDVVDWFPDLRWDADRNAPAKGIKRQVRSAARGDLFAYSVSGDSSVVVREVDGADSTVIRVDFPVYGPQIDSDMRVWVRSWSAPPLPSARVFSAKGEILFDYHGPMPVDAIGDRLLLLEPAPEDRSLLVIKVYDLPGRR